MSVLYANLYMMSCRRRLECSVHIRESKRVCVSANSGEMVQDARRLLIAWEPVHKCHSKGRYKEKLYNAGYSVPLVEFDLSNTKIVEFQSHPEQHTRVSGVFARTLRKATVIFVMRVHQSVRPHGAERLPPDGFS